jgi:SEC-C motif-containing protein
MSNLCHCGSGKAFADCCAPLLRGEQFAATPEALMRSRYSAFCERNVEYLLQTHLENTPSLDAEKQIRTTIANTQWLKLEVLNASQSADAGVVEFIAFYRDNRSAGQLHERSNFIRKDERWFYVDGSHLPSVKIQRNDPCWCGSGKKFKKCCGQ